MGNIESLSHLDDAIVPVLFEGLFGFVWQGEELKFEKVFWLRVLELRRLLTLLPDLGEAVSQLVHVVGEVVMLRIEVTDHDEDALLVFLTEEFEVHFKDGLQEFHV